MSFKSMKDLDLNGKTLIFREDFNVLMKNDRISTDKRIRVALPTLKLALEKGAGVVLVARYVALGDTFVMVAFATAPHARASTEGAFRCTKEACAGLLLQAEIEAFAKVLNASRRPLVTIVGGSKVDEAGLHNNLLEPTPVQRVP